MRPPAEYLAWDGGGLSHDPPAQDESAVPFVEALPPKPVVEDSYAGRGGRIEPVPAVAWAPVANVLFVCVANSGRSLMAERLFRQLASEHHQAPSAGSEPGPAPHPQVVEALWEVGIDASDQIPRRLDSDALAWADVAVSTCSEEVCPVTPGVRRISWSLPDSKNLTLDEVRPIRDEITRRVRSLADELDESDS